MRSNLPVTERQLELSDGVSLVSKTDLKGIITYANSAFVDVSGFRREELLGAPHNLVRHPDTPPEAFADLWNTLKRGLPWSGLVKNRCKSGDYYWVTANITPVRENGKVVGYMSVRTKAAPSAIATIEKFYAAMRAGRLRGERLEQGLIRPANPLRRLLKMNDWSIARRIYVTSTINGGVVLAAGSAFAVGVPVSLMPWVSIAVSMVCVLSGAYLVHSVARPLDVALDAANHIAAGEVTFRTGDRSASEIGRVLRTLQQIAVNVSAIVKDIKSGTSSIHRAAQALSEETFGLSRRTEDQASSLTETASSIEELSETVRQNASTAQRASQLADDASRIADDGGSAVRDVVTTMGSITESARKISEVVVLIDDIAFQTNLLALNAAVEAAHAGQHGKGFAVVAAEVRNLAQRSTEAAKEIKDLIGNSVTQVEGGYGLVTKAGETIDQVVSSVNEVRELMSHIAKATVEQSASLEQIGLAINQLEDITQQNVALVEETAAATETMQQDAARLDAAIDVFNASSAGQAPALGAAPNPSRRGAVKSAPGKMAVARRAA